MTTALQRTSLGELGYSPLAATSLGELGAAVEQVIEFFFGGGDNDRMEDERLILAIIKDFVKRI